MRWGAVCGFCAVVVACNRPADVLEIPLPPVLTPTGRTMVALPPPRLPPPVTHDELFDRDRILEVDLFMPNEDWEQFLQETRGVDFTSPDCMDGPYADPYTSFRGTAVIDRQILENVGIKKRGFNFSENSVRPSLEVQFDLYEASRTFAGRRRILLDSAINDLTGLRTCLAYDLFNEAGIPAPRCNFAQVRINGINVGIYAHVEPIDQAFTDRHFNPGGELWTARASDVVDGWRQTFEGPSDHAPLEAARDALLADDDQLEAALAAVIDLDAFYRFWATETVLAHLDGYSANQNRYHLYDDPMRGLLFIPWGTEIALWPEGGLPASVQARGAIARRLYLSPAGRTRHLAEVEAILNEVFVGSRVNAAIDAMVPLVQPRAVWRQEGFEQAVSALRAFVDDRRVVVGAEIAQGGAEWFEQPRPTFCRTPRGYVEGFFATEWGTSLEQDPFGAGTATISGVYDDLVFQPLGPGFTFAGDGDGAYDGFAVITTASFHAPDLFFGVQILIPLGLLEPGTFEIDNDQIFAFSLWAPEPGAAASLGPLLGGTILLEEVSTVPGAPLRGQVASPIY